jgi:hypothetical protein
MQEMLPVYFLAIGEVLNEADPNYATVRINMYIKLSTRYSSGTGDYR